MCSKIFLSLILFYINVYCLTTPLLETDPYERFEEYESKSQISEEIPMYNSSEEILGHKIINNEDYNEETNDKIQDINENKYEKIRKLEETEDNTEMMATKDEIYKELYTIFGIEWDQNIKTFHDKTHTPPQFMSDLYQSLLDSSKDNPIKPYGVDIVRALPEKESSSNNIYKFSLNKLKEGEEIIEAELHIYRVGMKEHGMNYHFPYYLLRVYQVMPLPRSPYQLNPDVHQLLHVHYISAFSTGWQVFKVRKAVQSWLNGTSPNLGLLVTATTILGEPVQVRFSRKGMYPDTYQPSLILFTKKNDESHHLQKRSIISINKNSTNVINRYENSSNLESEKFCQVHPLYIDFKSLGMDFVIAPSGFDLNYCAGSDFCKFPDILNQSKVSHANIQAVLSHLHGENTKVNCVPIEYKPLSVLYRDKEENIIYESLPNMSVTKCGCR